MPHCIAVRNPQISSQYTREQGSNQFLQTLKVYRPQHDISHFLTLNLDGFWPRAGEMSFDKLPGLVLVESVLEFSNHLGDGDLNPGEFIAFPSG